MNLLATEVFIQSFSYLNGKLITIYNPDKAKYLGYSFIFNNSNISDKKAVRMYFEKDIVEKSYKELKSTVNLHPIRKYLLEHVQAHIKICYLSYAILSWTQFKLKKINISSVEALKKLQPVHKVTLESKDGKVRFASRS